MAGCRALEGAAALAGLVFAAPVALLPVDVALAGFALAAVVSLPLDSAPGFETGCAAPLVCGASSFLPALALPAIWPDFGFGRFVEDDIIPPLLLP